MVKEASERVLEEIQLKTLYQDALNNFRIFGGISDKRWLLTTSEFSEAYWTKDTLNNFQHFQRHIGHCLFHHR